MVRYFVVAFALLTLMASISLPAAPNGILPASSENANSDNNAAFRVPTGTYTVLHNFTGGSDGANPWAGLTMDRAGNFYGIAAGGGSGDCVFYGTSGRGTIFKLTKKNGNWTFSPLYSFKGGTDGEFPIAAMTIGPNGSLYGTTAGGGSGTCTFYVSTGCGTVFNAVPALTPPLTPFASWLEKVLYRFSGGSDGGNPANGNLIFDQAGNIYGTTSAGGAYGYGEVFKLTPSGTETVLYSFGGGNDGANPFSGLLFDSAGNLYGTTRYGGGSGCSGTGCGTVYELTLSDGNWTEKILYTFQGGNDGYFALGGLTFDSSGNLYGGTYNGGAGGGGTVYGLTPSNGAWTFNVLYSFVGTKWGLADSLTMDSSGNLYGTTQYVGTNGDGNVFKLTYANGVWNYTDLHDFTYGLDGGVPVSHLVLDANGNLYGTAFGGGTNPCGGGYGCGVIFEITP